MINSKKFLELTGQSTDHLIFDENIKRYFHPKTYQNFFKLRQAARQEGIELYVLSSFRSFEDQLSIWNKKCLGEKTLYDSDGISIDYNSLSEEEIVMTILRWSALPGTSRHHWGSDIDVVDKNTWPKGYHVELIPSEFEEGAMFYKMKCFFDKIILENESFNFFRPYNFDQGGVAPEMWHISDSSVANENFNKFSYKLFCEFLEMQNPRDYLLLDIVKDNSSLIYEKFITNILES